MASDEESGTGLASLGLQDRLLEVAVVVGMDEESGLQPRKLTRGTLKIDKPTLYGTHFRGQLLDILSGPQDGTPTSYKDTAPALWRQSIKQITIKKNSRSAKQKKLSRARSVRKLRKKANGREEVPVSTDFLSNLPCICLPEDSKVYQTPQSTRFHSTILTDIAGCHHYAAVLTFYKQYHATKEEEGNGWALSARSRSESREYLTKSKTTDSQVCYVPWSVCFVSRKPYVEVLKDCLSCFYKELGFSAANSFRKLLEKYVTNLSLVVCPPPFIKVRFSMSAMPIVLSPPDEPSKPDSIVDLDLRLPLFIFLRDPSVLISVLACILLEQRVVFLSADYSLLALVMEGVLSYLRPMEWHHQYIPILFSEIVGFVDCPGIFMMGCHSKHKMEIEKVENDLFLVDLDNAKIQSNSSTSSTENNGLSGQFASQMPGHAVDSLQRRLSELSIHASLMGNCDINPTSLEEMREQSMEKRRNMNKKIQSVFMDFMVDLFGTTLQFLDHERLQFKSNEFLESLSHTDSPFYIKAVKSYMFRNFIKQRLQQTVDQFSKVAKTRIHRKNALKIQQKRVISRIRSMEVLSENKLSLPDIAVKPATVTTDCRSRPMAEQHSCMTLTNLENGNHSLFSDNNVLMDHFDKPSRNKSSPFLSRRASEPPDNLLDETPSLKDGPTLTTVPLPSFPVQGTNFNANHFYRRCIEAVNEALDTLRVESKSQLTEGQQHKMERSSIRAGLLLLRGFYRLAENSLISGLEDLYTTAKEDARFFPEKTIQKVVQSLSTAELVSIKKHSLYKNLPAPKRALVRSQSMNKSHLSSFFNDNDVAMSPLSKEPFTYVLEKNDITNNEKTISILYQALSENSSTNEVDHENFNAFFQTWRQTVTDCESARNSYNMGIRITQDGSSGKSSDDTGETLAFHPQEKVLKISGTLSSNRGNGRLVLTSKRLLFIGAGNQECKFVIRLQEILIIQTGKLKNFMSSTMALYVRYQHESSVPFKVGLKSDCDLWMNLINEMKTGVNLSRDQRDHMFASNTAAQNVMIADAFYVSANDEGYLKPLDAMVWVGKLCKLEEMKKSGQLESLSPETQEMLVMRMDPAPKESKKTGIRAMIFSAAGINETPHVWVALGSGKLRLITTTEWNLDPIPIKDWTSQPTCMCLVHHKELWVGAEDGAIYIILTSTLKKARLLNDHSSPIVSIAVSDSNAVVSAAKSGEVIVWSSEPTKVERKFTVFSDGHLLVDFGVLKNNLCCCSPSFLLISDMEGNPLQRLTLGEFSTNAIHSDLTCCAWDDDAEIWAADSRGAVYVWDVSTINRKVSTLSSSFHLTRVKSKEELIVKPKFSGIVDKDIEITCMTKHCSKLWLGNSAGSIHIFNTATAGVEKCLQAHRGPVTALCRLENRYMVSGSGGDEGKVIVWRQ